MKHFSLAEWVDFARNVGGEEQRAKMRAHLEAGCEECARALGLWTRVHEVARRESAYEPPKSAVQTVKAQGAVYAKAAAKPAVPSLLFDSARAPVAVGVRSSSAAARQLLYGVGVYRIDLRMEPLIDSDKVSVVGQILNSADPTRQIGGVPVSLFKAQKILAESRTNRFGEFHLECELGSHLRLELMLPLGGKLKIPLVEPEHGPVVGRTEVSGSKRVKKRRAVSQAGTRKDGQP